MRSKVTLGVLSRLKIETLTGTLTWKTRPPVSVSFESTPWYLRLQYKDTVSGEGTQEVDYTIPIEWQRRGRPSEFYAYYVPVFLCPGKKGVDCGNKYQKLYLPTREEKFLCRKCHNLAYRSEQDTPEREARKFFKELGLLE